MQLANALQQDLFYTISELRSLKPLLYMKPKFIDSTDNDIINH